MARIDERKLAKGISRTLVWYTGSGGNRKRHRKSLGFVSADEAKKALLEFELDILNKTPESVCVPLFEDYADSYKNWHAQQNPRAYERVSGIIDQHLVPYFGGKELDRLTQQDVESYQKMRLKTKKVKNNPNCAKTIKASTINKEVVTLKAMLTRAVNLRIIMISPLNMLRKLPELNSKSVGYFTRDELELIYDTSLYPHWWRLLANTGMRLGEARNLKWAHVKERFIEIESTEDASTKSGKWRKVPIGENVSKALLEFWRIESGNPNATSYPQIGGHVFPLMAKDTLSQTGKRAIVATGMPGSCHKFRHTYISLLAMAGTPLALLQILAGHSDPSVTMKYMHLSPEYLSGVAEHC